MLHYNSIRIPLRLLMVGEIISSTERTRYDGPVSMTIYGIDVIPLISMLIDKIAQEYRTLLTLWQTQRFFHSWKTVRLKRMEK